jgi:hypothetical protein
VMGTREASDVALMESNPLGIALPAQIEVPLNRLLRQVLPHAFRRLSAHECVAQQPETQEMD